jgi:hypothetical protein
VKACEDDIAKSLEGNWGEELLFVLEQEVELYASIKRRSSIAKRSSI